MIPFNRTPSGVTGEIVHDLREPLLVDRLPERIDAVVHTAGLVGQEANASSLCQRINVDATRELAEYAVRAGASRFILCSTGGVYQPTEQPLTELSDVVPQDAYGKSKAAAEAIIRDHDGKFAAQILRLFFPYGPGQQGRLIAGLIQSINAGRPITLMNPAGQPLLTPLYIDDLAEYVTRILNLEIGFAANVGGGEVASIRDLGNKIGRLLGRDPEWKINQPSTVPCNWCSDSSYVSFLTSYRPRIPLGLGLERTVDRMLAQN